MAMLKAENVDFGSGKSVGNVPSLSRKRILIRGDSLVKDSRECDFDYDLETGAPMSKRCNNGGDVDQCTNRSILESLPQDVLIRIIRGVSHADLNQLIVVSKVICEAARIAERLHFAFATPSRIPAFVGPISPQELHINEDRTAPGAPLRNPKRRRLGGKSMMELAKITVALFSSDSERSRVEFKKEQPSKSNSVEPISQDRDGLICTPSTDLIC